MSPRKYRLEMTPEGFRWVRVKRHHHHHHGHGHHHVGHHVGHHIGHHHHHRHWLDDEARYYRVSVDEWNMIKERERVLDEENRRLTVDGEALRAELTAAQGEVHRLSTCVVRDLEKKNETLSADNDALRQTVDKAADQAAKYQVDLDELRERAGRLDRENKVIGHTNDELRARIRELERDHDHHHHHHHDDDDHAPGPGRLLHLLRDVRYWRDEAHRWRAKFEALDKKHANILELLDLRTRRMESYEEMLRRRGAL